MFAETDLPIFLCAMTSARTDDRRSAYCSSDIKSARDNFFMATSSHKP
jgi:hypothetical protein